MAFLRRFLEALSSNTHSQLKRLNHFPFSAQREWMGEPSNESVGEMRGVYSAQKHQSRSGAKTFHA